jgi:glycosyltransferase involved in cell wall biosynthesis
MNENPILSIIVPVYRAEKFLADCIDSILAQTFTDYELILINDGSPDNSSTICNQYTKKDKRIRVIHKVNGGASSARNEGLQAALGKYIGWVDADDRISPLMFEKLIKLASDFNADIVECQYYIINGSKISRSGASEPIVHGNNDFIMRQFFEARMKPSLWNKLYKREIWNGIKFPTGRIHQDCYVNMYFSLMHLVYVRTSDPLYFYLIRKNSISTTHTESEIRQAIYLYEYTVDLAANVAKSEPARKYLVWDAINRLIGRYFEVSVNSKIKSQKVYNHYLRKKLGIAIIKYLIKANLPLKTRISYILLLMDLKSLQIFLHNHFGKK